MKFLSKIISTWFLCGTSKKAPGTIGSLAALPLLPIILSSNIVGAFIIFVLFLLGMWSITSYMHHYKILGDPREIVIDEVIGQLLTVFLTFITLKSIDKNFLCYFKLSLICFLFFRFFDVIKVWPINLIDKNVKGALGIIFDDVLAAIFAYISIILLYYLF